MKAVLDVHYRVDTAVAACVLFEDWTDSAPAERARVAVPGPAPYRPGRFYLRELPCLLAVLRRVDRPLEAIVIDGYVHLAAGAGKGLGVHLLESLPCPAVVVGVAKSPLKLADRFVPIIRGGSAKPLFVSAAGCCLRHAARCIQSMHGPHRIPTLLKLADRYCRQPGPC